MNSNRQSVGRSVLTCIGLALAVLAIYGQVWQFQFVNFDDDVHVTENMHVTTGLKWENLVWDFGIHGPSQWHPLAWLSHQLDCTWFGLNAGGHHLTSIVLHLTATILMFLTFQRLFNRWGPAAFTAAAFAVHPLNVESVAWVSERRNVLCAVFFILTLRAYLSYVQHGTWWRYALVLLGHAAALMSKPLAVTLPCVLLLLDIWPLSRHRADRTAPPASLARLLWEKVPLFALSALASILTILCQHAVGTVATFDSISLPLRLTNAVAAYGWYLQHLVWPFGLGVFYPHPALVDSDPWSKLILPAGLSAAMLIAISVLAIRFRRQREWLWLGWLWYLGVMVPMIGVLQVGEQQQADRYAYLPVVGLFLVLGCAGSQVAAQSPRLRAVVQYVACLILVGWGIAAYQQASYWRDSVTLFSQTLEVTERNHWAHNNLGFALLKQGKTTAAAKQFSEAIRDVPNYALAHFNLGVALYELGHPDAARTEFETTLRLNPNHTQAHQRLGVMLMQTNQIAEAIAHFLEAVRVAPDDGSAHFNLGLALAQTGQPKEAIPWLRNSLMLQPDHTETVLALAGALRETGQGTEAIGILDEFLKRHPDSIAVKNLLEEFSK